MTTGPAKAALQAVLKERAREILAERARRERPFAKGQMKS